MSRVKERMRTGTVIFKNLGLAENVKPDFIKMQRQTKTQAQTIATDSGLHLHGNLDVPPFNQLSFYLYLAAISWDLIQDFPDLAKR